MWAPFAPDPYSEWPHGWRPAIVIGLGKNRGDRTVVRLSFETGRRGRNGGQYAEELYWRKTETARQ